MAIQLRRGRYEDFDPSKLLPGEIAVVLSGDPDASSGRSVYICFEAGVVKRFTTYEDFETELQAATEEVQEAFTADVQTAINNAITATNAANAAQLAAQQAAAAAQQAAEAAGAYVLGDISDKTVAFTEAAERVLPATGESTATLFGKIRKWLADLGTAAFCTVANNLTTTVEGSVLDARQGKTLKDSIDQLNTDIPYSEYAQKSIGSSNTDVITTWIYPGIHLLIADYSFSSEKERADNLQIYDYTKGSAIGFSAISRSSGVHRGTLVKYVDIPDEGAHQIGVQASQDGSVTATLGVQFSVLTLKSY